MPTVRTSLTIGAVAVGLLLAPPGWTKKKKEKDSSYLRPPELMKLAESSQVGYVLHPTSDLEGLSVEDFPDATWPMRSAGPEFPWVSTSSAEGSRSVVDYPLEPECIAALNEAEPLFEAKQYGPALEKYLDAEQKFPRCYVAHSHAGDAYLFQGLADQALRSYERAIELNPFDYRSWFYKGHALLKLGEFAQARSAFVQSLALRPRNPNVMKFVERHAEELGVTTELDAFSPKALARKEGDAIAVYVAGDGPSWWLVWGMCKALWIGEPDLRKRRTGGTDHDWTSTEELDCLAATLENYSALREQGEASDPAMDRLLDITEDGMLGEFVMYEIGSRIWPPLTLTLPDAERANLARFVEAHVLPRREKSSSAATPGD